MRNKSEEPNKEPLSLAALWWIFIRVACASFGGFMAMISVAQNAVVERRKLLTDRDVLDGLSLASVLPGPLAINVVAYIGYRLRGAAGAAVSVCAAILPACILMIAASFAYFRWGHLPAVDKIFMGVIPTVTAIVVAAGGRMCRTSVSNARTCILAVGSALAILVFPGIYTTLSIIFVAGIAGWRWFARAQSKQAVPQPETLTVEKERPEQDRDGAIGRIGANMLALPASVSLAPLMSADPLLLFKMFGVFAGMSMLMFGGGYVFVPLLQHIVVDDYGWVTRKEFIDAVALGQVTPGPIMVSATFIGFKLAGLPGALVATVGMFGPSALLTVLCARALNRIMESVGMQAALQGVRAATVGMVFAAAVLIGKSAAPTWLSLALFIATLIALLRYRVEAVWTVPAAGLIGFLMY